MRRRSINNAWQFIRIAQVFLLRAITRRPRNADRLGRFRYRSCTEVRPPQATVASRMNLQLATYNTSTRFSLPQKPRSHYRPTPTHTASTTIVFFECRCVDFLPRAILPRPSRRRIREFFANKQYINTKIHNINTWEYVRRLVRRNRVDSTYFQRISWMESNSRWEARGEEAPARPRPAATATRSLLRSLASSRVYGVNPNARAASIRTGRLANNAVFDKLNRRSRKKYRI